MSDPLPRNEARRLLKLHSHEIMDTAPEPAYERVVELAVRFFAMPMAAITFVDEFRVWCKASRGLTQRESSREASFCAHAILQRDVLVIQDARQDGRFNGHLFDVGPESIRFYAGAALRTREGHALGALCVMDTVPREFTAEDERTLADMAAIVMEGLASRRLPAELRAEVAAGRQKERALVRQQTLLRRLGDSLEDRILLRTSELTRVNQALRSEIAYRELADAALQQAREDAENASAAKSEFLSRLSHELRTPLNAILGFGQILHGVLPAKERRDCASHVMSAGRHLLSLINELLDTARIEAGELEMSVEAVCVREVVRETLDLIGPLATARRITLEVAGVRRAGQVVLADRRRFKQVLLNLLSNAVKYSPQSGRIVVACRPERARTLRVSVTDGGPGVTPELAARLFVPFDRLGAENSGIQGTGLGLSLSKRFVDAMGGTIGVTPGPGRGSTFWVCLPLHGVGAPLIRETVGLHDYGATTPVTAAFPGPGQTDQSVLVPPLP